MGSEEAAAVRPVEPAGGRSDCTILKDRAANRAMREAAVQRMMASVDQTTRAELVAVLTGDAAIETGPAGPTSGGKAGEHGVGAPGLGPDAQTLALEEVVAAINAPPWLVTPLSLQARKGTPERRSQAVMALSSIRTRDSVRVLLALAGEPETPPPVRGTAYAALARLTGQDLGGELKAWSLWFTQVEWQPEAEWRRILAESLAARVEAAARDRDRVTGRLVEELRRSFSGATTPEARSTQLEAFIRDELLPVRRLGFSLALQELANARGLDQRVAKSALGVLKDQNVETRRSAAELLNVMAPENFAPALRDALMTETDPIAAGSLLRVAARWPAESVRPVALKWLEDSATYAPGEPAMDALAALLDAGMLEGAGDRERVLAVVRERALVTLPASGLRLLFALGEDPDRAHVLELLTTGDTERRRAVGEALVSDPRAFDPIINAAKSDLALYPVAIAACGAHKNTADGFRLISELPAGSAEARRQALIGFAAKLKPSDLLAAARDVHDPSLCEAILARLTSEPLVRRFDAGRSGVGAGLAGQSRFTQSPSVVAGLLLLCRTRLELGQPAAALKALDALTPVSDRVEEDERDGMRTVALLWVNKIDEAAAIHGTEAAWVDGLERSIGQPHAQAILRVIDDRFGSEMPAALAARLRPLRQQLGMSMGPMPSGQ